jgi:hypothetical protein
MSLMAMPLKPSSTALRIISGAEEEPLKKEKLVLHLSSV